MCRITFGREKYQMLNLADELKSIWSIFLGRYINEIERKVCEC